MDMHTELIAVPHASLSKKVKENRVGKMKRFKSPRGQGLRILQKLRGSKLQPRNDRATRTTERAESADEEPLQRLDSLF